MMPRAQFEYFVISSHVFHGPSRLGRGGWRRWLRAAATRWRERGLLEQLDDRMLRDIGISRSQALAEARKPFWRL